MNHGDEMIEVLEKLKDVTDVEELKRISSRYVVCTVRYTTLDLSEYC